MFGIGTLLSKFAGGFDRDLWISISAPWLGLKKKKAFGPFIIIIFISLSIT